jgi:hypothetical protein
MKLQNQSQKIDQKKRKRTTNTETTKTTVFKENSNMIQKNSTYLYNKQPEPSSTTLIRTTQEAKHK